MAKPEQTHIAKESGAGIDGSNVMNILKTEKEQQDFCINVLRMSWVNVRPIIQKEGPARLLAARVFQCNGLEPWWYEFQITHTPANLLQAMLVVFQKKG